MLNANDAGLKSISLWDETYAPRNAMARLESIRKIAPQYKEQFLRDRPLIAVRTLPVSRAPYPVSYAFNRACKLPYPFLVFYNRCLAVQFYQDGVPKLLLMNPTIPERSAHAPFFERLSAKLPFKDTIRGLLEANPIPDQLAAHGIHVNDVDYVAFDHQHTQDMRPFLGTSSIPKMYPNAKLLLMRDDWEAAAKLHPMQNTWFIRDSVEGVNTDSVVLLDGDTQLGEGCALLFTPGHTYGNQSLFIQAPQTGCYTVSENGICMDSYAPEASEIRGLSSYAALTGEEVILNANTLENSLDQYNSMIKEKLLADRYPKDPRFVQHFSSSELLHAPVAPGLRPTYSIGAVDEGEFVRNSSGV